MYAYLFKPLQDHPNGFTGIRFNWAASGKRLFTKCYVKFLDDFMKHVNISHFIVAGNSWGGLLAWYYSSQNQHKVTGLILIDAAGYKMSRIPKRFLAYRHIFGRWVLRYTVSAWLVKMGLKEVYSSADLIDNFMVTRYLNLTLREGNRQAFLDFIHDREWPDLKLLSLIQSPTLILWGRLDRMYNVEQAFAFLENLSNAVVAIVEDTCHMTMEEAPDVCAKHIHQFVNS
jgi:pimeloyl-ACP methyl ester carboxylesterase